MEKINYNWNLKRLGEIEHFADFLIEDAPCTKVEVFVLCNHDSQRVIFSDTSLEQEAYDDGCCFRTRHSFIDVHFHVKMNMYKEIEKVMGSGYGEWSGYDPPKVWVRGQEEPNVVPVRFTHGNYKEIFNVLKLINSVFDTSKLNPYFEHIVRIIDQKAERYNVMFSQ